MSKIRPLKLRKPLTVAVVTSSPDRLGDQLVRHVNLGSSRNRGHMRPLSGDFSTKTYHWKDFWKSFLWDFHWNFRILKWNILTLVPYKAICCGNIFPEILALYFYGSYLQDSNLHHFLSHGASDLQFLQKRGRHGEMKPLQAWWWNNLWTKMYQQTHCLPSTETPSVVYDVWRCMKMYENVWRCMKMYEVI